MKSQQKPVAAAEALATQEDLMKDRRAVDANETNKLKDKSENEINTFSSGVFFNIEAEETNLNLLADGKLSHHVCTKFGKWIPGVLEAHLRVEISIEISEEAYDALC